MTMTLPAYVTVVAIAAPVMPIRGTSTNAMAPHATADAAAVHNAT